jgi:Flp pilus assembly protein TadD
MARPKPGKRDGLPVDRATADRLFDEFEIRISRAASQADPRHHKALEMLGQALTRVGRHQEALEADLRVTGLKPKDAVAYYNLACSYSNLEEVDAAFEALHRAFDLGYNDYRHLLRDPDLVNLRKDRRFKTLLNRQWGKRQP